MIHSFTAILVLAWVGHAYLAVLLLNNLYARPISKSFLKRFRLFIGLVILAYPFAIPVAFSDLDPGNREQAPGGIRLGLLIYAGMCALVGGVWFPLVTFARLLRRSPPAVLSTTTRTIDYWPLHRHSLLGNGKWKWVPRLPGNCVFRVDFTEITLAVRNLPAAWEGLTILHLSDLHFHGTPSQMFFQEIVKEITSRPVADLVVLAGDYVDTDQHHEWLAPVLGSVRWNECGLAVLGNHDDHHQPERLRHELASLGYRVLGNAWETVTIRGVPCLAVGHEGPWFRPPPSLSGAPEAAFRLCVSHTPDNVCWGRDHGIDLMLSGHVHGGQIRLPGVGSIFVPSLYSRRFDMGVFDVDGTALVVSRGLSGKEPLRFRCHPQVIWIRLTQPPGERSSRLHG